MSDAMAPLRDYAPFIDLLLRLESPLLGILVGAVFTALIQIEQCVYGNHDCSGISGLAFPGCLHSTAAWVQPGNSGNCPAGQHEDVTERRKRWLWLS